MAPSRMCHWNCLGNVRNWVDYLKMEVKGLNDTVVHLNKVIEIHLFPLLIVD